MSASKSLRTSVAFDAPENEGKSQSPHKHEAPICPLLRVYAQRHLRGGLETMMVLAWLCENERVREVATLWSWLTHAEKLKVEIERLCQEVGVEAKDFIREAAGTAWELGVEFPLKFDLGDVRSYVQQVEYDLVSGPTLGPVPVSLYLPGGVYRKPNKRISHGERAQSMEGRSVCDTFAAARRNWRLSQAQFASLLMTSIRTVRRWEDRLFSPTPDQQWLIERFVGYVKKNGRRAFLRRFVRQTPRYRNPGRPGRRKRAHERISIVVRRS